MNDTTPRRMTRQQSTIADRMDSIDDFVTAQQLHGLLRDAGETIGLATVYRALQAMATDGSVDVLRNPDGDAAYRRCSTGHHHHLVCRECGRTVEVEGPTVEKWASTVSREHGFVDVEHTIEIFGRCADCASRSGRPGLPESAR